MIGSSRLLQNSGQPDVREPKLLERSECGGVDLVEFAYSVDLPGAVRLTGFVEVAEQPDEKLIDARTEGVMAEPATDFHRRRAFRAQIDFAIMRNVFVPFPGNDRLVLTSNQPSPCLAVAKIFRISRHGNFPL